MESNREPNINSKVFIGIDPGKTGAITTINEKNEITSLRFPMIGEGKGSEYDIPVMCEIFRIFSETNCHIVIEDVKALQKPMEAGNWGLSRGKTILEVLCHIHNIPHTLVHSKTWQKEMWQGVAKITKKNSTKTDTKAMSLVAAKRLYPTADLRDPFRKTERAKAPQDGVVDSLLLAGYCKRKF